MKTTGPRIIVAVLLILIVSIVNGISGVGYTVGGEFEASMQAAAAKQDPRWLERQEEGRTVKSPRDASATVSLLLQTKYGRFGLALQVLCALQFVAGIILMARKSAGPKLATFLVVVGLSGIAAEIIGINFSGTLGRTNIIGIVTSIGLAGVAMMLLRAHGTAVES